MKPSTLTRAAAALGLSVFMPALAWAQAGLHVYVPNRLASSVSVYVTNADGTLTAAPPLAGIAGASFTAVSPDQRFTYITATATDKLHVIDTATQATLQIVDTGEAPMGIAVSPDG